MLSGNFIYNNACTKCNSQHLKSTNVFVDIDTVRTFKKCEKCGHLNDFIVLTEREDCVKHLKDTVEPSFDFNGWETTYFEPDVDFENRSTFFNRLICKHDQFKLRMCLTCGLKSDNIVDDVLVSHNWTWQFAFCPENSFDRWANSRHIVKTFYDLPSCSDMEDMVYMVERIQTAFNIVQQQKGRSTQPP